MFRKRDVELAFRLDDKSRQFAISPAAEIAKPSSERATDWNAFELAPTTGKQETKSNRNETI